MKDQQVQALNYSAHAIESLKEWAGRMVFTAPESCRAMYSIIRMLESSVKFIMPNRCDLIDRKSMGQSHLDLVRLPYPVVAFEAPWVDEHISLRQEGEFAEQLSTRRIALCWELGANSDVIPDVSSWFGKHPDGGVFVLPIYWDDTRRTWLTAVGGMFIPYKNQICRVSEDELDPPSKIISDLRRESSGHMNTSKFHFTADPFVLLPEIMGRAVEALGSIDKVAAHIQLNATDEVMMMIQACAILNCANVQTMNVEPAAAINRKRVARGNQPFFTYKVLQLAADDLEPAARAGKGGSHASPRMHIRRGHPRNLENRTIWIKQTTVNAGSKLGKVAKDYKINR